MIANCGIIVTALPEAAGENGSAIKVQVTKREPVDAKGGVVGFRKTDNGGWRLDILESGSVHPDDKELFATLGLTDESSPQPFNTNTVILDEEPLHRFGSAYIQEHGYIGLCV